MDFVFAQIVVEWFILRLAFPQIQIHFQLCYSDSDCVWSNYRRSFIISADSMWFLLKLPITSAAGQMAINFMVVTFEWFHMARLRRA